MSISIIETLENAKYNYNGKMEFQKEMAKEQLTNAIAGLEAEIDPFDESGFERFLAAQPQKGE